MNICLFSPIKAAVKIDGEAYYIGKSSLVTLSSKCSVIEYLASSFEPSFVFTNNLTSQNMRIIELYDGFLFIPRLKKKRDEPFAKIIEKTQSYFGNQFLISVYTNGGTMLSIKSQNAESIIELPFKPSDMEIIPHSKLPVIIIILKGKKTITVAVKLPELEIAFKSVSDSVELGDYVTLKTTFCDIAKHTVTDYWQVDLPFKAHGRKISAEKKSFIPELIPYVFLEEVALQGDYRAFLSEELKERANLIPDFLGKIDFYIPPFNQEHSDHIILVSGAKAKYLQLKISNGLIDDVNLD